jgi:hypothetical protein
MAVSGKTDAGIQLVIARLRGLLAIVNRCVAEAEKQIANQRERIDALKAKGQPTVEEEQTLDVMLAVASAMRDSQAMIQVQISGLMPH